MLFEDWAAIGRVALLALLTYAWLVLVLRAYGKRTLAKLNAFDFVVTVALGSILATALLSPATTWAQAATAFVALSTLQWLVARLSLRWPWFHRLIRSRPRLLLLDGRMLGDAMRAERIAEDDIRAAVRREGRSALSEVHAVVLETDGTLSVLVERGDGSRLRDVAGYPD
jgi:uncharacterized membrane protein YcaP (DUF421 family)